MKCATQFQASSQEHTRHNADFHDIKQSQIKMLYAYRTGLTRPCLSWASSGERTQGLVNGYLDCDREHNIQGHFKGVSARFQIVCAKDYNHEDRTYLKVYLV